MSDPDSNIDKLFGDRLRNDDQGFREEHWHHMEKLLDAQSVKPAPFFSLKTKLLTLLLAAAMGTGAIVYFYKPADKDKTAEAITNKYDGNATVTTPPSARNAQANVAPGQPDGSAATADNAVRNEINQPVEKAEASEKVAVEKNESLSNNKKSGKKQNKFSEPEKSNADIATEIKANQNSSEDVSDKIVEIQAEVIPAEEEFIKRSILAIGSISSRNMKMFPVNPVFDQGKMHRGALTRDSSWPNVLTNKKHQFKIVIGANSFKGMKDDSSADKWGITPLLGLSYEYRINPHLSLSAELDYVRRGGNSLNRSTTTITYFHHKEYNVHSLKTKTMDFIFIPITANYKLMQRHYLKAGVSASVLLNTISDRKETYRNYYTENATITTDLKGYYDGFRKFSPGLTVGYEFRTDVRSYIGFRYSQSLMDITDNKIFKNTSRDMMSDFQLYIRLNAF